MSRRPRIRTLKPEAWQDDRVGRCSRDARLLWVTLITMADDEGRFRLLPSLILGHAYPFDRDAARKLDKWIAELCTGGLLHTYTVDGLDYGMFPKWAEHQKVSHPTPSILPAPSTNGNGAVHA